MFISHNDKRYLHWKYIFQVIDENDTSAAYDDCEVYARDETEARNKVIKELHAKYGKRKFNLVKKYSGYDILNDHSASAGLSTIDYFDWAFGDETPNE